LDVTGDVSLNSNLDVSGDVILNQHLDVTGDVSLNSNLDVSGDIACSNITGYDYQIVGESNNIKTGEWPFSYGAGAYDQDISFGYPVMIKSVITDVGLLLSDISFRDGSFNDNSVNYITFEINDTEISYNWIDDLSGFCKRNTTVYPIRSNLNIRANHSIHIQCTDMSFATMDVIDKARIVLKCKTIV